MRTIASASTAYLYDFVNPVQELSGGTPTANLLAGLAVDEHFTRTDSSGARHFLRDALGSTLALTDSGGSIQTQYTYEPFGKSSFTGSASSNSFEYTGRENEGTGLFYYRARYYNPGVGRFISEDPITWWGGQSNFYAYVRNSPTNHVDPSGLRIVVQGSMSHYQQAITYLSRDPGMAAIIRNLNASPTIYPVILNNNNNDSYVPSNHEIHWDPHSALRCRGGGKQSPALGLGHEMAHADQPWYWRLMGTVPWPGYDNLEERRVILGPETNAARTLGEGTRTDHFGTPYRVPTPTSR